MSDFIIQPMRGRSKIRQEIRSEVSQRYAEKKADPKGSGFTFYLERLNSQPTLAAWRAS